MIDHVVSRPADPRMSLFFFLWAGQLVALLGGQVSQFALVWWLTEQTGSATVLALASMAAMLPGIVLGPFIGVLVDRWSRKSVLLGADTCMAAATLGLAALFALGLAAVPHVVGLILVRGFAIAFTGPALLASTTLMVPERHLGRIQGLNQGLGGGLSIVSPLLGALLYGLLSMERIMEINTATALGAIATLVWIRVPRPAASHSGSARGRVRSVWSGFREGLRYLATWRALIFIIAIGCTVNLSIYPCLSLMPLLVRKHFGLGATELAWMGAAYGIGIVAGGLLLTAWKGFKRQMLTSMLGLLGMGFGGLGLGLVPGSAYSLAVLCAGFVGAMISVHNAPIRASIQRRIEPGMQGRVFTLNSTAANASVPVGLALAGPLADALGIRFWFLAAGITCTVAAVFGLLHPTVMRFGEASADERAAAAPSS